MLATTICRLRGHRTLCEQDAVLYPDGRAELEHRHTCLRCRRHIMFTTEPLPDELNDELRGYVPVTDNTTRLGLHPTYAHPSHRYIH